MCKCTPSIRTPYCGKPGCLSPVQKPHVFKVEKMSGAAWDTLWAMFKRGPLHDGDMPSKTGRDWLVEQGFAERGDGYNWLTRSGVLLALELGMGAKKEVGR